MTRSNDQQAPLGNDPAPWRRVSGSRVADIYATDSPGGGFMFDPRPGYANYADRYISTRKKEGGRS